MSGYPKIALASLLVFWTVGPGIGAAEVSRDQLKSLDEQVQDIKSDVLGIDAELTRLEEKLLYPSGTQISMFLALKGAAFRLDAVEIRIDGKPVMRHVYSFKELEALQKGGVQRLYTGNIGTGAHELQISAAGKMENGSDYRLDSAATINKEVGPKLVEIHLTGPGTTQPGIEIRE